MKAERGKQVQERCNVCSALCDCWQVDDKRCRDVRSSGGMFPWQTGFLGKVCKKKHTLKQFTLRRKKKLFPSVSVSHWSRLHPEGLGSITLFRLCHLGLEWMFREPDPVPQGAILCVSAEVKGQFGTGVV